MARKPRDRKEATFFEHLEELRMRLIRCIIYVAVGAAISWFARETLMEVAQWPIYEAGQRAGIEGIEFKAFKPAEALVLTFHIAFVAGIILAAPAWLMEAWLFVEPALEDHERRWVVPLLPAAVGLFLGGVAFCYSLCPRVFAVLLGFQEDLAVAPEFILRDYLGFFLRLLLIFGVMFEMPLVIMFLSAVGMVRSQWLLERWRIAVVLIAIVCAIVTPTPDAVTLSFLAGPMIGLYMLSILLARMVEKGKERARAAEAEEDAASAGDEDPYAQYALPEAPDPEEDTGDDEAPAEEEGSADEGAESEPHDEEEGPEEQDD
jgi:sec-independent protein translocase protein TatC